MSSVSSQVLTTDKLNAIWIVLEAFGHARTCLNMNATRVSHIFSLDFDMTGAIASASIQVSLCHAFQVGNCCSCQDSNPVSRTRDTIACFVSRSNVPNNIQVEIWNDGSNVSDERAFSSV